VACRRKDVLEKTAADISTSTNNKVDWCVYCMTVFKLSILNYCDYDIMLLINYCIHAGQAPSNPTSC